MLSKHPQIPSMFSSTVASRAGRHPSLPRPAPSSSRSPIPPRAGRHPSLARPAPSSSSRSPTPPRAHVIRVPKSMGLRTRATSPVAAAAPKRTAISKPALPRAPARAPWQPPVVEPRLPNRFRPRRPQITREAATVARSSLSSSETTASTRATQRPALQTATGSRPVRLASRQVSTEWTPPPPAPRLQATRVAPQQPVLQTTARPRPVGPSTRQVSTERTPPPPAGWFWTRNAPAKDAKVLTVDKPAP
ncbi:hypothetical protein K458DRAFT_416859 [Lentithecium fluviatile CBS 122367]|uniref:Uncharacterized protein n=1 Tax=Lentithecium fluviatile CBS 122367 TaxID=1168545 RepID=A0A6G1J538_9PLEO|nr:hypothetical protein K458DRAFT_416859 [Lentithecium fluviatile CBS 122367]